MGSHRRIHKRYVPHVTLAALRAATEKTRTVNLSIAVKMTTWANRYWKTMNCPRHFCGHWTSHALKDAFNNKTCQELNPRLMQQQLNGLEIGSVWGNFTFESLLVVSRLKSRTEPLQVLVLSTVHDKEEPPKHVAGQGSIRHLRHEQPDSQPVGFEEAVRNSPTPINASIWGGDISGPHLC